jgi:hypothetical protein
MIELEAEVNKDWKLVLEHIEEKFQKKADMNAVLFVIGLRELGQIKKKYTKEQKQDLINLAVCSVLSLSGYFKTVGKDKDGWPVWEQDKPMPRLSVKEQELNLKQHIIHYFETEGIL